MPIKRNSVPQLKWYDDHFAETSTLELFSYERWGVGPDWNVLLEQAKKIDSIVLLIDKYAYGSRLFASYIDILEANIYIYDDLFYALIGTRIGGEHSPEKFIKSGIVQEISKRLFFWNLDWREEIMQMYRQLVEIRKHIIDLLNQRNLEDISKIIARRWSYGCYVKSHKNDHLDIIFDRERAHQYALYAYQEDLLAKPLAKQILTILSILDNSITVFGTNFDLPKNCFPFLLEQFRESENAQELIKAWEREFNGSRDSLIAKMEKDLELNKWVHRYLHLQDRKEIVEKLFLDEDGCWLVDDKEYYNTRNWINILKVATLLQEYDERQNCSVTKPKKNTKRIKSFREFIKDAGQTEEIISKLHRLIGNKTNSDALKIIAKAMWIGWLDKPTASSIQREFSTIQCSAQQISKRLNEPKPTHVGMLEEIKTEFESV